MGKLISLFFLLAVLISLGACQSPSDTAPDSQESANSETTSAPESEDPSGSQQGQTSEDTTASGTSENQDDAQPDSTVKTVVLYLPNDTADGLEQLEIELEPTAENLVDALVQHGALPEGTQVNSFAIADGTGQLDLSSQFASALQATGTAGESMYLACLVNTLTQALDIAAVRLTCDGEILETGHSYYDEPIEFFDWETPEQTSAS